MGKSNPCTNQACVRAALTLHLVGLQGVADVQRGDAQQDVGLQGLVAPHPEHQLAERGHDAADNPQSPHRPAATESRGAGGGGGGGVVVVVVEGKGGEASQLHSDVHMHFMSTLELPSRINLCIHSADAAVFQSSLESIYFFLMQVIKEEVGVTLLKDAYYRETVDNVLYI